MSRETRYTFERLRNQLIDGLQDELRRELQDAILNARLPPERPPMTATKSKDTLKMVTKILLAFAVGLLIGHLRSVAIESMRGNPAL